MGFTSRDFQFLSKAGVGLAVDVSDSKARVAIALVNRKAGDRFSKRAARTLLNLQFDATDEALKALNIRRNLVSFPYNEVKPRNDILRRLIKEEMSALLDCRVQLRYSGFVNELYQVLRDYAKQLNAVFHTEANISG